MKRRWVTVYAVVLAVLAAGSLTAFADSPRPECDRSDSNSLCQANITIFVFVDRVSSGGAYYDSGVDSPLYGARITFVMPDGSRLQRVTGRTGLLSFPDIDFLPGDEAFLEIEYPAQYRDAGLVPCRSSPVRRRLTAESFGSFGSTQVVFCAEQYLSVPTEP